MNKNNKGFMLLETLIVSTIILSTLVFLFVQFTNIKTSYEISFRYNTVPGIYMAKEISDFLIENNIDADLSNELDNNTNGFIDIKSKINSYTSADTGIIELYYKMITDMDIKQIIYTSNDLTNLKSYLNSESVDKTIFTEKFKEFIFSLKDTGGSNNRLFIMFGKNTDNNTFTSIIIGFDICINGDNAICFKFTPKDPNWKVTNVHDALEYLRNEVKL